MKRQWIILGGAVAVAAGIFLLAPRGPQEPVYQGKHLTEWLAQTQYPFPDEERTAATNAIRAIGTNALPYLLSEFTRPAPRWRNAFNDWISARGKYEWRLRGDEERIRQTAVGLHLLGSDVAPAVPTLATYLADAERGIHAARVMSEAGEIALPYFVQASSSTNTLMVHVAAIGLGRLARKTEAAVPFLVQLLNHTNSQVRLRSACELASAHRRPDLTVPLFIGMLSDPDVTRSAFAARTLEDIGEMAKPALPHLLTLMTNSNAWVAHTASNAVFQIDPTALPARTP